MKGWFLPQQFWRECSKKAWSSCCHQVLIHDFLIIIKTRKGKKSAFIFISPFSNLFIVSELKKLKNAHPSPHDRLLSSQLNTTAKDQPQFLFQSTMLWLRWFDLVPTKEGELQFWSTFVLIHSDPMKRPRGRQESENISSCYLVLRSAFQELLRVSQLHSSG